MNNNIVFKEGDIVTLISTPSYPKMVITEIATKEKMNEGYINRNIESFNNNDIKCVWYDNKSTSPTCGSFKTFCFNRKVLEKC